MDYILPDVRSTIMVSRVSASAKVYFGIEGLGRIYWDNYPSFGGVPGGLVDLYFGFNSGHLKI